MRTEVGYAIAVPDCLRAQAHGAAWCHELTQIGVDLWVTHMLVDPHTDNTAEGLITYGLVVANREGCLLRHGGFYYSIPAGTLYRIDGRIEHSTCGRHGLFAALIWDMPPGWELSDFAEELRRDCRFNQSAG